MTEWHALEIIVPTEAAEAIEFALNELSAEGTEINNLGPKQHETLNVVGYFNERPPDDEVATQLGIALEIYSLPDDTVIETSWKEVENRDWLAEWKKNWKPTVTGSFIVAPAWQEVVTEDKIVIRIEPSMAFGTGTHETTRLCLRAIEETLAPGETFLDVGTGTGILSIAAAKLQISDPFPKIFGCDTDIESVRIAKENVEINNVNGIELVVGSLDSEMDAFDFVCANLTADVILPMLPLLVAKSKRLLLLSGILVEQEESILKALRNLGCEETLVRKDGEWISVLAVRSHA